MKTIYLIATFLFSLSVQAQQNLKGAYQSKADNEVIICLIDGYFVETKFNSNNKVFNYTWGGPFVKEGNKLVITIHFDSRDKAAVGKTKEIVFGEKHQTLIDKGENLLAGNWRISGRKVGDQITENPLRARRTYKLLTGTRFQWMAINIETGEFSGTGGGTYQFINGKYTEYIEFFSRDSSRVGASLSFTGKVENGQWHHSGLSSKGDPIYEIWTKN
ncbi:hypothetical protein [Sediminibacterium sp.]|uniref:hypothetical protein n=1 Tax=Sediminibacterium sp. TaxID=1917865 RepID=UPI003F72C65A